MRSSVLLAFGLSSLAIASPRNIAARDVNNLPTIKATLQIANTDAAAIAAAINALTAANADTQSDIINNAILKLSSDLSAQAKKIGASGSVGIMEAAGLLQEKNRNEWLTLVKSLADNTNATFTAITSKLEIIKVSGKVDKVTSGIKSQKQAILDIIAIVPGQIPSAVKGALPKSIGGTALPDITAINSPENVAAIGKSIDNLLDQLIGILKGTQTAFSLPPGVSLPAFPTGAGGNLPAAVATPAAAPAAAAATPKSVAPKGASPKGTTPKGSLPKGSSPKGASPKATKGA
jgi:hypothetical protein